MAELPLQETEGNQNVFSRSEAELDAIHLVRLRFASFFRKPKSHTVSAIGK